MKQLEKTNRRTTAVNFAVVLGLVAAINVNASPISGVTVTASSEYSAWHRWAHNLVDGDVTFGGNGYPVWQSIGVGVVLGVNDRDPWLLFDLQEAQILSHMTVINFPEWIPSVKEMLVEVSLDNVSFSSLGVFTLNFADVEGTIPAFDYPLGDAVGRYVRFDILSTYGGSAGGIHYPGSVFPMTDPAHANGIGDLAGLTEVSFFGEKYVAPPPTGGGTSLPDAGSTAAMLCLGVAGLIGVSRTRRQPIGPV